MRVEHRLRAHGRCPVDQSLDVYTVIVRTNGLVKVEDILAAVAALAAGEPIFQEALTKALAEKLRCEVETIGFHSGVETRVIV